MYVALVGLATIAPGLLHQGMTNADELSEKTKFRRYALGPLKIEEFRRSPAGSQSGRALTMTRVLFDYRFDVRQISADQVEASLSSLEAYSAFLPYESWWNHRDSERLLAHEQGHFDLAEITARRVQLTFKKLFEAKKAFTARGRTREDAVKALEQKLARVMKLANQQAVDDNKQYDLQTLHGARIAKQQEHRRVQLLTLERLKKDLAKHSTRKLTKKKMRSETDDGSEHGRP